MTVLDKLVYLVSMRIAPKYIAQTKEEIFSREEIESALTLSLSAFNMHEPVTYLKITDEENMEQLADIIVTYAAHVLLFRQSLIERGREVTVSDHGVEYIPPPLGPFLMDAARDLQNNWFNQVRSIKNNTRFVSEFVDEDEQVS